MKRGKIYIIGTGIDEEDLSSRTKEQIHNADLLVGTVRLLTRFSETRAKKIEIKSNINALIDILKKEYKGKTTVVLASGDPNFFGIAQRFYTAFPHRCLEVMPNVTAFQTAFARIHQTWEDAVFVSVHGRDLTCLDRLTRAGGTYVVYCDGVNTPERVARYLVGNVPQLHGVKTWVFEDLGMITEKITSGKLGGLKRKKWSGLSMMIIQHELVRVQVPFGIPDAAIAHRRGMITKRDVRLMDISRLNIAQARVLWDVGAGSGSVSIEAAESNPALEVFAVEKDRARYAQLVRNVQKFSCCRVHPVRGQAPNALADLPAPDAVFIGGSGGALADIMAEVKRRLRPGGVIVINCVTLAAAAEAINMFKRWCWPYEVASVNLAYLRGGARPEIFKPEHQVFIVHARR